MSLFLSTREWLCVTSNSFNLPTFEIAGMALLKPLTMIVVQGRVMKVFYPVFPPDKNAADVVDWLRLQASGITRVTPRSNA